MESVVIFLTNIFKWISITSAMASILVIFILLTKKILKNYLSPRWQYIMWFLVIIRLILPWSLTSSFSIFNVIEIGDRTTYSTTIQNKIKTDLVSSNKNEEVHIAEHRSPTISKELPISSGSSYINLFTLLSVLWIIIGCLIGIYTLWTNWRFIKKLNKSVSPVNPRILEIYKTCKTRMSIRKNIRVVESHLIVSPMLVGFLFPKIILPKNTLENFTDIQLKYVFLHELAHVKRCDLGINWIVTVIMIFHWFNPILWYTYIKMREDQELACDASALRYVDHNESKGYGNTIIALLESCSNTVSLPSVATLSGTKKYLVRRIKLIKQFKKNSVKKTVIGLGLMVIIGGVFLTNSTPLLATDKKSQSVESIKNTVSTTPIAHNKEEKQEVAELSQCIKIPQGKRFLKFTNNTDSHVKVAVDLSRNQMPGSYYNRSQIVLPGESVTFNDIPNFIENQGCDYNEKEDELGFGPDSFYQIKITAVNELRKPDAPTVTLGGYKGSEVQFGKEYKLSNYIK